MNLSLISLEIAVVVLGLVVLVADLWLSREHKRWLGYGAALVLFLFFLNTFTPWCSCARTGEAFGGMFVQDALAVFFKRFFLLAGALVLVMAVEFADRVAAGIAEYYALVLFALVGMLVAASANDFVLLFVSMELITITFYVLTSFTRERSISLEAGVKYLILGALASAFMVFGIALVWGMTGKFNFTELTLAAGEAGRNPLLVMGIMLVLVGLGFKVAAVPFQVWVPDVYQGAPTPTTAFLAVGSKAAGFVLLLRVLFGAVPDWVRTVPTLLMGGAALTVLYGNLCALPQRNLKRLLGYSGIAHAGYLLLGVAAMNPAGSSAILFYLVGYLVASVAAFAVIIIGLRHVETEDIAGLAGLSRRAPLLAATITVAMASLAGVPPLVGFWGKFLLFKAVLEQGAGNPGYYVLALVAVVGVVVSFYYYFGVVREMYWGAGIMMESASPMVSEPIRYVLIGCVVAMLGLGLFPGRLLVSAEAAVRGLSF